MSLLTASTSLAPSPARLATGEFHATNQVAESTRCGDSGCHPDITAQWDASVHHHSSFSNPFYLATLNKLFAEPDGEAKARWCAGCHDPALLFTGNFGADVDPASPLAQEGVGCLVCHAMDDDLDLRGNGGYAISYDAHLKEGSLGNLRLRLRPGEHRDAMLRPLHGTSEFCLRCHKVSIPPTVNGDRWRRGQNEYDAWHQSGVSGHSVSSFYRRATPVNCIDCHMPLVESNDQGNEDGRVRSHRFAAANHAIPFLNGDVDQVREVEDFLSRSTMRIDVMGLEVNGGQMVAPATEVTWNAGDELRLFVVVRNLNVGHHFPGGTIDSNEAWIRLRVTDARGREIFANGELLAGGQVDPRARVYRARLLSAHGEVLEKRDIQHWKSTAIRTTIGPGACDVARYRFTVPHDAVLPLSVDAALLYRKFSANYTAWVFRNDQVPSLPVLTVASARTALPGPTTSSPEELAERFNDLGIGLFLQDDLRRADAAFDRVVELWPDRPDGAINRARVALVEGNLAAADSLLNAAADLDAAHPTVRWLRGKWLAQSGQLPEAIDVLSDLSSEYPLDRDLLSFLAEQFLLMGRPQDALASADRILDQDPESLAAFTHRLAALRLLGAPIDAAEAAVRYHKADETEAAIAGKWLAEHPLENLNSQLRWEAGGEQP